MKFWLTQLNFLTCLDKRDMWSVRWQENIEKTRENTTSNDKNFAIIEMVHIVSNSDIHRFDSQNDTFK